MIVYHKSFEITFHIIDAANSSAPSAIEIDEISLATTEKSFPSLIGNYAVISK